MAVERLNLEAYWGSRKESIDECAAHVLDCLRQLAVGDEAFAQPWLKCGNSRKEALANKIELTSESLRNLLAKGRNRYDTTKEVIEDLGFYLGRLWNGWDDEAAAHVAFHCGAYPKLMPMPNDCLIEFPYGGPAANRIVQVNKLGCVMAAVVSSWDPDVAAVSSYQMRAAVYPQTHRGPWAGWLTYLSDRYGALPALPEGCEVTRLEGQGSLIVLKGFDRLTASNPAHVEAVWQLSDVLERAGMLAPTPPHAIGAK